MNDEDITNYIFLNDDDPRADLAFVFGTWKTRQESVDKAAEIYKKGFVPKIIVSGGPNETTGVIEGDFMAEQLEKLGVPKKDIIIENKAANSLENVVFSTEILNKQMGLENIDTITAVVRNYHSRRALMTLRKHLPFHIKLKVASYSSAQYPFTKDSWQQSNLGREKVMEEMDKIKTYLVKGDLVEL